MSRKKTAIISLEYKNGMIAIFFLFISIVVIIAENNSPLGEMINSSFTYIFGEYYKFIFSPVLILISVFLFKERSYHFNIYRIIGLFFFFISISTLIGSFNNSYLSKLNLFLFLEKYAGANIVLFSSFIIFIISLIILFKFSPIYFTKKIISFTPSVISLTNTFKNDILNKKEKTSSKTIKEEKMDAKKLELEEMLIKLKKEKEDLVKAKNNKQLDLSDIPKKISVEKVLSKSKEIFSGLNKNNNLNTKIEEEPKIVNIFNSNGNFSKWEFPSLELLDDLGGKIKVDNNEIRRKEIEIQEKLLQFKIEVDMMGFKVGPTVIQFRLKPRDGVKLQKIVNLKKDLTLALHAKNIRIQAPIPGVGLVGIEVPNDKRQVVGLKELLSSSEFRDNKNEIPIAVGKDVSGNLVIGDLAKMPHLLVAGQTASGKSIGMNSFLISLLYKFTPIELKLIMIDPKRVELSVYNGIPHLLTPVITSPDKALNSLKWCVAEMLRRYDLATLKKARNLKEYNAKVSKDEKLPYIVIVIDELADLMMSGNKKEVEGTIARIAQMARAVGMHLIVATQRPSVDVITGLIKANIPSRIAFTVASQIDSRTIIDKIGAEDLLGRGDMLYNPTGVLEPERVQGVLVDTHEVEAIVNKLKLTIDPEVLKTMQDNEIANGKSTLSGSILENYSGDQEEDPEIIEKALLIVKQSKKGSTSLIQRKLGLGYGRAAKILDILEELGVVGPANGSKPREVYVD